jgi:transketolase
MRNAFADEITKAAAVDPRVVLLSGDIGNRLFNKFQETVQGRFFNCGVAEANMMGVAAGMALSGLRPFAYTITPFITSRCFEQIKLDVCYHKAPVVIVGVGAGLSYASLGPTHHSFEDIGSLRTLPGLSIVCPADALELRAAIRAALCQDKPVYLRMGKKGEPVLHSEVPELEIGKAIILKDGTDVCLLAAGPIANEGIKAADELMNEGISLRVVSFHTVKPLDESFLQEATSKFPVVVTLEEHSIIGGLGGGVAEWMVDNNVISCRLIRLAIRDEFMHVCGSQSYARSYYGISVSDIAQRIRDVIRKKRG